jgi:hypothetical protein
MAFPPDTFEDLCGIVKQRFGVEYVPMGGKAAINVRVAKQPLNVLDIDALSSRFRAVEPPQVPSD